MNADGTKEPYRRSSALVRIRGKERAGALPWAYACILAGIGVYICREAFVREAAPHFNSMQGEWLALARIAGLGWFRPRWWPYWGAGAPIQYAYAPLIPFSIAALARLLHSSPALALSVIQGLVYCLGPLALYLAMWRLTKAPGWSFLAALVFQLAAPPEGVDPNGGFGLAWFVAMRRGSRLFEWDDLPHQTCLALLPAAVWLLARALQGRRAFDHAAAGAAMALMMLASMFGFVLAALAAFTVPWAMENRLRPWGLARAALVAAAAYLAVSPWAPPSLFLTIRSNAVFDGEAGAPARALLASAILAAAWWLTWRLARRSIRDWPARWIALFACPAILVPALDRCLGLHFLLQPQRYVVEMEPALALAIVFALRPPVSRIRPRARALLAIPLLLLAAWQVAAHRRSVKTMLQPVDIARSIERRSAKWVAESLPGQRVMMTGSMATWLNVFTDSPQLDAQSYSTAANQLQQLAQYAVFSGQGMGERDAEYSILWLKAFGAQAVAVPGPQSPEYWRPFARPRKFDGVLPVLWREDDTTIYRVPQASASLAHVMRPGQVVRRRPYDGMDVEELRQYVAALDNPPAPASFEWRGANEAMIRARLEPGQAISAQVTFDRGWRARVNGAPRVVRKDGIGLMVVEPDCAGDCEITLDYDGGWEAKACRAASAGTLLLAAGAVLFSWRRRVPPGRRPFSISWRKPPGLQSRQSCRLFQGRDDSRPCRRGRPRHSLAEDRS